MPATPRRLEITAKDLEGPPQISGGTYSEIEVDAYYEAYLADVSDYDKRDEGKSFGWLFLYQIETSTGPADFPVYLAFSGGARWKIVDVFAAHGVDIGVVGISDADPNSLIGDTIGVHVDFPRDKDGQPTNTYRELQEFFPLVEAPEENITVAEAIVAGGKEVGGATVPASNQTADEPEVL